MTNRRDLFKLAGLAGAAAFVPTAQAKSAPVATAERTLKGGVVTGQTPLGASPDLKLSETHNLGRSVLQDGTVMNASHWGIYKVHVKGGKIERLEPFEKDNAPSLQLQGLAQQPYNPARIRYPMVRKSYLEKGYKAGGKGRGSEPFVRVSWDKALQLVADELVRVRDPYGAASIYGGFTGHYGDYSTGCAQVVLPYVIGSNGVYEQVTSWELIADRTELVVLWGAAPTVTNDIDWATTCHENAKGLELVKKAKIPVVAVNPLRPDTAEYFDKCDWIAPKPGTDVAMMLGMAYELESTGKADHEFLRKYTVGFEKFRPYLMGESDGTPKTPEWASKISGVPAAKIRELARLMRDKRSMLMGGWGIQRAQFGEQVLWMMVVLAAMCGHIGLPGGGFGFTYHYSNGGAPTSEAPVLPGISANPKGGSSGLAWEGASLATIPLARFTICAVQPRLSRRGYKAPSACSVKMAYPDFRCIVSVLPTAPHHS